MPALEEQPFRTRPGLSGPYAFTYGLLMGPETAGPERKGGRPFALLPSKDCYMLVSANPLARSPRPISGREAQATPRSSVWGPVQGLCSGVNIRC